MIWEISSHKSAVKIHKYRKGKLYKVYKLCVIKKGIEYDCEFSCHGTESGVVDFEIKAVRQERKVMEGKYLHVVTYPVCHTVLGNEKLESERVGSFEIVNRRPTYMVFRYYDS